MTQSQIKAMTQSLTNNTQQPIKSQPGKPETPSKPETATNTIKYWF